MLTTETIPERRFDVEPDDSTPAAPGAHANVDFLTYFRWSAINWHGIEPLRRGPLQARHEIALPADPTKDMKLGSAFHTAILEPHRFEGTYATMPDFPGHPNSNDHKAAKNAWLQANGDKVALTKPEMAQLRGMQRAVFNHPTIAALLNGRGRNELSITWKDEKSGEMCKGRVDRLARVKAAVLDPLATGDIICVIDFKKTSRWITFDAEIAKYAYDGQQAFYVDGLASIEPANVVPLIIAVQDDPPHDCEVINMMDLMENGRRLYRRLFDMLLNCRKTNYWPGRTPRGSRAPIVPKYHMEPEDSL